MKKRILSVCVLLAMLAAVLVPAGPAAEAKTTPMGQTVGEALFYITNSAGQQILVSQLPVSEMEADMEAGKIDDTLHNYALLDKYTTTLHQEAEGFTVPEFVAYAQSKSGLPALRELKLTFAGADAVRFWEIDQTGFDDYDTYTYDALYGVPRYNFPLLYRYWNYTTQDYDDPDGKMSRDQVIDHIFAGGQKETALLSVRAFSQRYMITDGKYGTGDYNMENYWHDMGLLDNERTLRLMKPMTKDDLYNKTPTAADSRYWVANILLDMAAAPDLEPLGAVVRPTAAMTEDADNYYIRFDCATPGATILYNHNYISPSYVPTMAYDGTAVVIPKSWFPSGTVTMTARAVKEGCTDAGVVTLKLTPGGTEQAWQSPFTDVKNTDWFYNAVGYVMTKGLFDTATPASFEPDAPMTRAMLATALYRLEGSPAVVSGGAFTDVPADAPDAKAVQWAFDSGIVQGDGGARFNPDGSITREQIAAMLCRYASYKKEDATPSGDVSAFPDAADISAWAEDAMKWAVGQKLISGMGNGTLSPQGTATRAQVAQILRNDAS
ncbi:S-layer homology domain-containing protein [Sporobacter termitidis DSM 10068]|uniref:S-layer homology domain-containing protein n=1 Tax=Sporobacter termitidis DSM 10068 TaxID=1123282 RepID=A0A1M5XDK9_9FIRM|nr:S-layer homology domain-containing protein [Sporobacter termitidis]SHH97955.1 S-layer homology domain-containing protein [Sporobacter termitidis DSM 10068]